MHNSFFVYIYPNSLHVSSTTVLITGRISCINITSGICHSMQVTVKCAGLDGTSIQTCTLDGHLHRVTYTRLRINTIDSTDDERRGARNMQRIVINIYEKRIVRQVGYLKESNQIFLIVMDPCIVDYSVEIPTGCSFVIEFIIPKVFLRFNMFQAAHAHHQEL